MEWVNVRSKNMLSFFFPHQTSWVARGGSEVTLVKIDVNLPNLHLLTVLDDGIKILTRRIIFPRNMTSLHDSPYETFLTRKSVVQETMDPQKL